MRFNQIERVAYAKGYRVTEDGRLLNPCMTQLHPATIGGYPCFKPSKYSTQCRVHRLAAFQMFGDAIYQEGMEVRHGDNGPLCFAHSNLKLGTHSENMMDRDPAARRAHAVKASSHIKKYNHAAVIAFYEKVRSYRKVMAEFGINSKGTVSFIVRKSIEFTTSRQAAA
jgi:hypothetical protein